MPLTLNGNGAISGLGDIDGHDLETNTLVNVSDATFAAQAVGRATLFIDASNNRVGINTTTPSRILEISDNQPIVGVTDTANSIEVLLGVFGGNAFIGTETNNRFDINTGGGAKVSILANGNVGINTTNPGALLHIESNAVDAARLRLGFDSPRYYDIFRGSATNSGLLNFYGSQAGFTGYVFDGVNGERMRINVDGKVGIGVTNPAEKLDIGPEAVDGGFKLSGQSVAVTSNGLTIDYQPNIGVPTATDRVRYFAEPRSTGDGESQHIFYAYTGGVRSESTRITGNGISFPNGQGIDFSASQGSGATSSTLDDYEEGTWTPSFAFGTWTYSTQQGIYTIVGNVCTASFLLSWSARTGTGQMEINLPFVTGGAGSDRFCTSFGYVQGVDTDGDKQLVGTANGGGLSRFAMYYLIDNNVPNITLVQNTSVTGQIQASITYQLP